MALSEVELVEGDAEPSVARPPRRRRWRWVAAIGAVVAVGGLLAGGQAVLDARERAHLARFDDVAGVLAPVSTKPRELWTMAADENGGSPLDDTVNVQGHLVAASTDGATYTIRSIDRATGKDAWTITGEADVPTDVSDASTSCQPLGTDALVACVVEPNAVTGDSRRSLLVVIDASDGTVVDRRPLTEAMWAAGGGAFVAATSTRTDDTTTWTLDARDATGKQLWHRTLEPVVHSDADRSTDNKHSDETALHVSGSRAVLTASGAMWWLERGVVKAEGDLPRDTTTELLDGVLVRTSWHRTASEDGTTMEEFPTGTSLQMMGHAPIDVDGDLVRPDVDDGSGGIVLVRNSDGVLTAYDTTSGRPRWSARAAWAGVLVLGGTVYQVVGDAALSLVARDAATGDVRWSQDIIQSGWAQYLATATDGRYVYAVGSAALTPFAIDDGTPQPDRPLPTDLSRLSTFGFDTSHGVLLLMSQDEDGSTTSTTAIG